MKAKARECKVSSLNLKKSFVTAILVVSVLAMFTVVAGATTHYVNPGDSINSAVDSADPGDTIIVRDGTYNENVLVKKRLTIRSENGSDSTTVAAFMVTEDYVNIRGFTVTGGDWDWGIYLYGVDHCIISDNHISNNTGILLYGSDKNDLTGNTANSNNESGIYLSHSNNNTLTNNIANSNSVCGIWLYLSYYNTLTNNIANSNTEYGIYLDSSRNNTLTNNTANSNGHHGIYLHSWSNYNTLTSNTANENNDYGIYLDLSRNNTLTSNTANENNDYGIDLYSSYYNTLTSNTANENNYGGIYLHDSSNYNTLTKNTANSNTVYGIYLYSWSRNNMLTSNTANSNNEYGIYLHNWSNNNSLTNNIVLNNVKGIYLGWSSDNLIYNNYFNNTNNAYDNGNNIWNITKTPGTNIVWGPYIGGNYWSDYVGNDTDGDHLGDTLLPYNCSGKIKHGGDYHPLIWVKIDISVSDIVAKVLVDGENATVNATAHTDADFDVSNVKVRLVVNDEDIQEKRIEIPKNASTNVTFDGWNVSWSVKDNKKQPTKIEVVIDPDNEICDTNRKNNTVTRYFPLAKGEKKADADGRGFIADSTKSAVYAVPIAIWFDDDAFKFTFLGVTWEGAPTRHYNPIATDVAVLNDIEMDFNNTQFSNGSVSLSISNFTSDAEKTFTTFWKNSSGIVIVNDTRKSAIVGAPIASYLNWPMAPSSLLKNKTVAKNLIEELNINYTVVIADDKNAVKAIINDTKNLDLEENQTLFVKGYAVEPLDNREPTDLFKEVLDAFGDKPSGIVVTNSRAGSSSASAPLAAFYKSMILDVRDVVTGPVSYAPNTFAGLNPINNQVNSIIDKAGEHDIKGFIPKYMAKTPNKTLYLVGTAKSVPFGIERDPCGNASVEATDSDWIASDYRYYHAHPNIEPGGRMALDATNNLNYVARALQFDELPVGDRDIGDGWEDNIMGVGIYNPSGKRRWANNRVWWLDSVVYQVRDLSNKAAGMEVTRLFEDASAHNGGLGKNWYRFDNRWGGVIKKAPLYWDTSAPLANPAGGGNRGDGVNNDGDKIGSENNNDKWPIERIIDNNSNSVYDAGDVILNEGLIPGIQSAAFVEIPGLTIDEEVWDGYDNDGDGTIDEDCSFWRLLEVEEVYNEKLTPADPDIDPGDFADLVDINLFNELDDKGIIIYSGHSWTDNWAIHNIGGNIDPDGAGPIPPLTSDDRTGDNVTLSHNEVPAMAPSLVIASSCGSCRLWEANCIALEFLKKGSLAYIGSTSLAYGSSDEFRQQMFRQIVGGRLHIGRAFKSAVDNLDQNDLWANRYNENNIYADKTRYEFNLFGLGSTEIDPGEGEERVAYGTPVYDSDTKTWGMNISFDIPGATEIEDAEGNVTEIIFPIDLLKSFSDDANYPALYQLPFDYELPIGGNFSNISLVNATVYKVYNFSQYKLKDYGKWPVEIVPMNMSLNETLDEELELYDGPLFPDVLFVNSTEHDSLANRDRVFGSVAVLQVNGTINKTIVYDEIMLKLTYTAPVGIEETHVVAGNDLAVYAAMVSTDGKTHLVKPSLVIETVGGIIYKEVSAENMTVSETPQTVTFEVSDIELPKYVGRVIATEEGKYVAETSFTVTLPNITSFAPPSPVSDVADATRTFNITIDQIVNVSWYLNGTYLFMNKSVSEANCTLHAEVVGEHNVSAIASNSNGTDMETWVWNVTAVPAPAPPNITSFAPPSPVNDTICNWSTFSVTVNQTINVSWYLNDSFLFTNESVTEANCTLHAEVVGEHNVSAIASNSNGTDMQTWVWNVTSAVVVGPPNITALSPVEAEVSDTEGAYRTFSVTVNQTVNVRWLINGTQVRFIDSVTEDSYTNVSAAVGYWNVSAIVENENGRDMHTWWWNVTKAPSPCYIATATYGTPLDENINVLRDFRDEVLMTNPVGEAFVSTYYGTSPPIADALRENDGLRTITGLTLITPLVYLSKIALNGILFVFIIGLAVVPLYLRKDRKRILKPLLVGTGAILVFTAAIFSLGFVGYTIPICAVVGAYMLPFVIPLSVVFTLCTVLKLHMNVRHNIKTHAQNSKM